MVVGDIHQAIWERGIDFVPVPTDCHTVGLAVKP